MIEQPPSHEKQLTLSKYASSTLHHFLSSLPLLAGGVVEEDQLQKKLCIQYKLLP
jgi:hypothetical protein